MAELFVRRLGNSLVPDGDESVNEIQKLPLAQVMHCIIKRERNIKHLRLYWVMVNRIAAGIGADPENVSDVLKIASGHYTTVMTRTMGELRFPRSIAIPNLEQDKFNAYFERCLQVVFEEWGISKEALGDLPL